MDKKGERTVGIIMDEQIPLTTLLGDEDPDIFKVVKQKIISLGPDTKVWLKPCQLSDDHTLRDHASEIIRHFDREDANMRFLTYCMQDEAHIDLEKGALLMSQTQYPEINLVGYTAILDNLANGLRAWLVDSKPGESFLTRVNQFFFEERGFCGNMEDYYNPDNSFISRVLDDHTGNPTSLCIVYALTLRRLGFPIDIIGMPGHTVCRFCLENQETYINAFALGHLLTRQECLDHIKRCDYQFQDQHLAPMKSRRTLARMCGNLEQIYIDRKQPIEAERVHRYVFGLTRNLAV